MAKNDEDLIELLKELNRPIRVAIPGSDTLGVALEDLTDCPSAVGLYKQEWGCVYFVRERKGWSDSQYHQLATELVKELLVRRQMN